MKRLFFLFAVLVVAAGAMAQGPHGLRGHHNDRHGHGDSHRRPPMEQQYYECATSEQMRAVMDALNGQSFDDKKLEIAKLCVTIGYFCTADMAQMATVFSFDDRRLEFFKYAYAIVLIRRTILCCATASPSNRTSTPCLTISTQICEDNSENNIYPCLFYR